MKGDGLWGWKRKSKEEGVTFLSHLVSRERQDSRRHHRFLGISGVGGGGYE